MWRRCSVSSRQNWRRRGRGVDWSRCRGVNSWRRTRRSVGHNVIYKAWANRGASGSCCGDLGSRWNGLSLDRRRRRLNNWSVGGRRCIDCEIVAQRSFQVRDELIKGSVRKFSRGWRRRRRFGVLNRGWQGIETFCNGRLNLCRGLVENRRFDRPRLRVR